MMVIDREKFSQGMSEVFHGLGTVFESIGVSGSMDEEWIWENMGKAAAEKAEPVKEEPKKKAPKAEAKKEAPKAEPKKEEPQKEAPSALTYDQVVRIVTKRANKAHDEGDESFEDSMRKILAEFGCKKISEMDPEKYEDFISVLSFT